MTRRAATRHRPQWARRALLCAVIGSGVALGPARGSAAEPPAAPPAPPSAEAEAATYERCFALAKKDPAAARDLAEAWHGRGGAHPADHCLAVALIGMKEYEAAAVRLEKLGRAMVHAPAALRAQVLGQAGQAWLLAGDPVKAYAADGLALSLSPDDPDLLVDRAEAAGSAGWFDKAIADLDRVLKAAPTRVDALIYRAAAYREAGRLDPAAADLDKALELAPDSVPGLLERGNIRRLKGDLAGAREDWARVVLLAPGSAAETAAQRNIARLAEGPPEAPPATTPPPP